MSAHRLRGARSGRLFPSARRHVTRASHRRHGEPRSGAARRCALAADARPAAIRRLSLPGHHPARLGLGAPQDATGAERCAVSVGPSIECSRLRPIAPASASRDYRTTDREIHVSVTVPSSHPGRREARPADRTSRALHRLLRCRQRRALPSKDSSRSGPPASCRPFPRRSPW